MSGDRRFGGEVTEVLWATLHPSSAFIGAGCGFLLAGALVLPGRMGAGAISPILAQAIVSLFVVKVAVEGRHGPDMGSLIGGSQGWGPAFAALGRLFTLNLLWAVPAALAADALASVPATVMAGGNVLGAIVLLFAMALLPPLFLLVAVAADTFGEIFDFSLWRRLAIERAPETVMLYVAYLGGLLTMSTFSVLMAAGLGAGKPRFTIFLMLAAGSYTLGITIMLLGRLVGSYLRDEPSGATARPAHPLDEFSGPVRPVRPERPAEDLDSLLAAASKGSPDPDSDLAASRPVPPAEMRSGPVTPVEGLAASASRAREESSESITARLRANERKAEEDPNAALDEIEQMLAENGPHPLLLTRLAVLKHDMGSPEAIGTASRAARAAIAVNNFGVLADLFEKFGGELADIELDLPTRIHMAGSLAARHHFDPAVALYRAVLADDPSQLPAIKGLIQIADQFLKHDDLLPKALEIYDALDEDCPNHQFADFVERGRDAAERRLSRAH